jgi:signal transduction histidine kinase
MFETTSRRPAFPVLQSLRGRLVLLLILLVVAAVATGVLMVGLFRQSAVARSGQAQAETGQACDAIAAAYRFYSAGWQGPAGDRGAEPLHRDLTTVTQTALRARMAIEGGVWQQETGSLGYAFPTYQGSGPKTDLPQAELPRIKAINQSALTQDRPVSSRYEAGTQILLMTACPLPGPIPALTAWTMTRVVTLAGTGYQQLMAGFAVLLLTVLAAAVSLSRITMTWSRHVGRIENVLRTHDVSDLPVLPATGEHELDRIVNALNEVGRRLAHTRARADELAAQVTTGERLAAIGRVAAGVAHEIRNPIAAMRLKAENALVGDPDRKDASLVVILSQIDRLDRLLERLLRATETEKVRPEPIEVGQFIEARASAHSDLARLKNVTLKCESTVEIGSFDAEQMRSALDNLISNAIQAAPPETSIVITASHTADTLQFSVQDEGTGPPERVRERLFEPFVTGRPEGTGLGLSIVREVAAAHGGTARMRSGQTGTTFDIEIPWQTS